MAGGAGEKCGETGVHLQFLWLVFVLCAEIVSFFCALNLNGGVLFYYSSGS